MRIYLDLCAIERPFDDQRQLRIRLETHAILEIIARIEAGTMDLVASSALLVEHRRDEHELRRALTGNVLALASEVVSMDARVASRAESYRRMGLKEMDAAHLACAVECCVDFFCTCDDRLLRRAKRVDTGLTRPVTLLELLEEVER